MRGSCRRRRARGVHRRVRDVEDLPQQAGRAAVTKPLAHMRDCLIVRGALGAAARVHGVFSADLPAACRRRRTWEVPVYVAATAPMMGSSAAIGDGLLTPSITTPELSATPARTSPAEQQSQGDGGYRRRLHRRLDPRHNARPDVTAREIAGMYLANKFQNIKGSADTLLTAEIGWRLQPSPRRSAAGGSPPRSRSPTARPARPSRAPRPSASRIEEYRDAGCTRHARALGRRPPRADPAVRRAGCRTSADLTALNERPDVLQQHQELKRVGGDPRSRTGCTTS